MPLVSKSFSDIITFSRASTATYFDSAGVLQSAAIDVPRFDYNPATLAAQGLLIEEQRTNLLLQSEDFATTWTDSASPIITTNTTVAPDGTTTADTVAATVTSSYVAQIITFTGDGTKTYSLFIKAGTSSTTRIFIRDTTASASRGQADITWTGGVPSAVVTNGSLQSLQACPNGWYRLAIIVDSVVAANTNQIRIQPDNVSGTGDVILWGAQAENGAFSTSYIPTTTTALTRSADVASVNTLSPWFNASEGTLYAQAEVPSVTLANRNMASIARATPTAYEIQLSISRSGDSRRIAVINDLTNQFTYAPAGTVTSSKGAVAYKTDDSQGAFDGASSSVDTSVTLPTLLTTLYLGNSDGGTANLNGWLKRVTYYPRRLSQAELEAITS